MTKALDPEPRRLLVDRRMTPPALCVNAPDWNVRHGRRAEVNRWTLMRWYLSRGVDRNGSRAILCADGGCGEANVHIDPSSTGESHSSGASRLHSRRSVPSEGHSSGASRLRCRPTSVRPGRGDDGGDGPDRLGVLCAAEL